MGVGSRGGLGARVAVVTIAVAAVATLLTGLVSVGLVRGAAESQARRELGRQADVVATIAGDAAAPLRRLGRVVTALRLEGVTVARVSPEGTLGNVRGSRQTVAPLDARLVAQGRRVDAVRRLDGRRFFVAGRPATSGGGGVLLVAPAATRTAEVTRPLRARLAVALLIGLAGAAVAGLLLARRIARPLQQAAAAAHQLAAGERDLRLRPDGPTEVAQVAVALNSLAGALATSEGRQREFLLSVSHELRTPLTAVRGYAEALADGVVPAAEVAATGRTVLAEAARLDRLVSDLLDLARLGADDFRLDVADVDLVELVAAAGAVWRRRAEGAGVAFTVELPAAPLRARTDPTRLRQILDGLAENALRVTPSGAPIVFALRAEAGQAVLEVRDGGPGLTDADLPVAFERSVLYERYRGVRRVGTGVGLALVAGLTARLGGRVTAGHAPEGGACFTVRLPAAG